jgi:glycine/D-amino acid oxidase-like deaminating enzyme
MRVLVVGGGIFGVTAALELRARGCDVTLVDPGPLPHPLAESTDISKVVRIDYGADEHYTELAERALDGWRRWNATWPVPRFHETGVAFLSRAPMQPGGFEHDSFELLARRGHAPERLDAKTIVERFPAYRPGAFVDGYFHRAGGWAESGAVVAQLVAECRAAGVDVHENAPDGSPSAGSPSVGSPSVGLPSVASIDSRDVDATVVCAGAWTQQLVPELAGSLRAIGQPVFHLRPRDPSAFDAARFPVFGADIARTGYYGFPVTRDGVVKIANHGTGIVMAPDDPRDVTSEQEAALRAFVADAFPALATAPITASRLCVYGDTIDGHFWIAQHPARPAITVAAGGSGHAFKFAPILGALIADAVFGRTHPRFRWRPELAVASRGDAARSR